jgi:hypothetical protein
MCIIAKVYISRDVDTKVMSRRLSSVILTRK